MYLAYQVIRPPCKNINNICSMSAILFLRFTLTIHYNYYVSIKSSVIFFPIFFPANDPFGRSISISNGFICIVIKWIWTSRHIL